MTETEKIILFWIGFVFFFIGIITYEAFPRDFPLSKVPITPTPTLRMIDQKIEGNIICTLYQGNNGTVNKCVKLSGTPQLTQPLSH